MKQIYEYDGKDTCAADGMCKEKCPVKINTGDLIKQMRAHDMQDMHPTYDNVAAVSGVSAYGTVCGACFQCTQLATATHAFGWLQYVARHFGGAAWIMRQSLAVVNVAHGILGPTFLESTSNLLNRWSGHLVPTWTRFMPKQAAPVDYSPAPPAQAISDHGIPRKVVYLPACVTRIMGPSRGDAQQGIHRDCLRCAFSDWQGSILLVVGDRVAHTGTHPPPPLAAQIPCLRGCCQFLGRQGMR